MSERVFISYSEADSEVAERLERALGDRGVDCFRHAKDIGPGQRIEQTVVQALLECSAVIVVISPASARSAWVSYEIGLARGRDKLIVPFLTHTSMELPSFIGDVKAARSTAEVLRLFELKNERPSGTEESRKDADHGALLAGRDERFVVVYGGANLEYSLEPGGEVVLGRKHDVEARVVFGGSGVNYTMRLLRAGVPVLPVLSVGNDEVGRSIQSEILEAAVTVPCSEDVMRFVASDDFFVPGLRTGRSTIIVDRKGRSRTILREPARGNEGVLEHVERRTNEIVSQHGDALGFVMVGHIQSDRAGPGGHRGRCTERVLDRFREVGSPVFLNPGSAQIEQGFSFWKNHLDGVEVLQLNLGEMRAFLDDGGPRLSLASIVDRLQQRRLTGIVTLDRFGAICTHRDVHGSVLLAWPFRLDDVTDTTGAGDAFGAGVVSVLRRDRSCSYGHLFNAVDEGRTWAAFACTKVGGASECPDVPELARFRERFFLESRGIEVKEKDLARDIFWILDQT
jgi:sugar/nucleoside kinase (ribokinase family)